MSLPIAAAGPLNVETKPILIVSPAAAGLASASAVAPASQNAVLICLLPPRYLNDSPVKRTGPSELSALGSRALFLCDVFLCSKSRAFSKPEPPAPPRTFGSIWLFLHHNSYLPGLARIIVQVAAVAFRLAGPSLSARRMKSGSELQRPKPDPASDNCRRCWRCAEPGVRRNVREFRSGTP